MYVIQLLRAERSESYCVIGSLDPILRGAIHRNQYTKEHDLLAGKAQPQKKNDVVELARLCCSSVDSKDLLLYGKQHIIISFIDF